MAGSVSPRKDVTQGLYAQESKSAVQSVCVAQVLGVTFDGASVNRRLLKLSDYDSTTHKVLNMHAPGEERYIYFFSDPPHLIKTTRNCWASNCRTLWVSSIIHSMCIMHASNYNFVLHDTRKMAGIYRGGIS